MVGGIAYAIAGADVYDAVVAVRALVGIAAVVKDPAGMVAEDGVVLAGDSAAAFAAAACDFFKCAAGFDK